MALENTDLMVVQKQDGGKEIRKASLQQLSDYIAASDTVVYKGLANFTQAGEEPGTRNTGDLYINNALADGTWQWSTNSGGVTDVSPGDRCIWNGTNWDIIQSGVGDAGVETVSATLPLSTSGTASEVVVESRQATTTLSGHVARLATDADVTANTGSGSATAVVTADLLKKSNEDILSATSGGVTSVQGVDPLEVHTDGTHSSTTNSPAVSIKDSAIGQKGAIAKYDSDSAIGDPKDQADFASWVATQNDAAAVTPKFVAKNYVLADFEALADA